MRPMVKLAGAVAVVVGLLAAGGYLLLARRDSPSAARLRPGSGTTARRDCTVTPGAPAQGTGRPRPMRRRA